MTQAAATALDPRAVFEADARSKEPIIAKRLLRFCSARTRDPQRAKDAASDALLLTLAGVGWHRWVYDGKREPVASLLMHLCSVAKDVLKQERERASTWREVEGDPERDAAAPDSKPRLGEMPAEWARQDEAMRHATMVMERLDEDARRMLRMESESDEDLDAAGLATKLGWTVKQVYRARERVVYHRDQVRREASQKKGGGA
jgi:DNA-directed RNA polymerase specialized sigma24 family protein